jgi:biopolymer transport protein ExbD
MRIARRPRPGPWIPFITLADIAWQIIIFFLVGATFVTNWSLSVTLPSASVSPRATLGKTIRVEASEAKLTLNGMPVEVGDLELQLNGLLAGATSEEQRGVVVAMADDVSFQRNSDILYAIQQAGGVVLITEEERNEAGPAKD